MALPVDFNTIRVYGTYVTLAGVPAQGTVSFSAGVRLRSASTKVSILPAAITAELGSDGSFSVDLPATDDPDIDPGGFVYAVTETFGNYRRTYNLQVPLEGGDIDLTDAVGSDPITSQMAVYVRSVNGEVPDVSGNVAISADLGTVEWTAVQNKPIFAAVATSGAYGDLSGKPTIPATAADVGADASGSAAAAVSSHVAAADPHSQYHTDTRGDARYYTKATVDSSLAAKANTSSLATVATSGSYNDLTNKPTIPAAADLSDTPRYVHFSTSWPARPSGSRMVLFVGGTTGPTDAISGDVWIPASS